MKSFLMAVFLLLGLGTTGLSQDENYRYIRFDEGRCPAESRRYIAAQRFLEKLPPMPQKCELIIVDGKHYRSIFDDDLQRVVIASVARIEGYWVFNVQVHNHSTRRFLIEPSQVELKYIEPKSDQFVVIPAIDPSSIARKYSKRAMWANIFRSLGAGMARRTTTVDTTVSGSAMGSSGSAVYSGHGTSTISEPDRAAQDRAARENAATMAAASADGRAFLETALLPNTVFPNALIMGNMYYKPLDAKKSDSVILTIMLDGTAYMYKYAVGK